MNRRVFVGALVAALVMPLVTVQACGPDFFPDVFVYTLHPDAPKDFAAGKLGVLLPTYPRADLAVAYRYLIGGKLGKDEQAAYAPMYSMAEPNPADKENNWQPPAPDPEDALGIWFKARAAYETAAPQVEKSRELQIRLPNGSYATPYYANCFQDAFRTAALTVNARAKAWGAQSPALHDWIAGQDAVFANCRGGEIVLPAAPPADSPALLVQDRAYQTAAAQFYAADFEAARAGFEAIGHDTASPWHGIGLYLAARSLVRQAFLTPSGADTYNTPAVFDKEKMHAAQAMFESLLKDPPPGLARATIQKQLDLVRLRTEPMTRLHELAAAVAGPAADADYSQHLIDLTWYLDAKLDQTELRAGSPDAAYTPAIQRSGNDQGKHDYEGAYKSAQELRDAAPLADWLISYQSPSAPAREHAIAEWKHTGELPWLVAAIGKATAQDAEATALVAAAADVKPDSPAWATLTYHRIRLLMALGRAQEARTALAAALPQVKTVGTSAVNLFSGLHMRSATTLDEALAQASRTVLERESEEQSALDECQNVMKDPKRHYDCKDGKSAVELAPDAARWMNLQAPLATLVDVAASPILPERVRQAVAMMTWTRAVLLKDDGTAARVFSMLPKKLQEQTGAGTGFKPLLALVRNPGLRPYLDEGVQRSYSFDFVESYGDNWWCSPWNTRYGQGGEAEPLQPVAFLPAETQKAGVAQAVALEARGDAQADLGAQVVAYVDAHPADPDAAEALYLVLRMVRYGCNRGWSDSPAAKEETSKIDQVHIDAARLLRKRYTASPWTRKAAPFAGKQ